MFIENWENVKLQLPDPLQTHGPPITVFHAFTREEYSYPEHKAPYLLIANFGSCGDYILNGECVQASDRLFYFANAEDELEICFRGRMVRETLLMIFDYQMVREAGAAWRQSPSEVLEDVFGETSQRLEVPRVPFSFTEEFRQIIDGVRRHVDGMIKDGTSERALAGFFEAWSGADSIIRKVPSANASTRQELYKRLMVARAFMEANAEAELTVERIAREALMNRFYFLELFGKVFGVTRHRYLRNLKLDRAFKLLRSGHSVTEVCQLVEYKSVGSFSNLFKNQFGYAPSSV